uniref:Protein p82 n=1 Tax=Phalaenopsis equestris Jingman-related virus TaxID=2937974 RepID=A0AAT9J7P1_9FLAV
MYQIKAWSAYGTVPEPIREEFEASDDYLIECNYNSAKCLFSSTSCTVLYTKPPTCKIAHFCVLEKTTYFLDYKISKDSKVETVEDAQIIELSPTSRLEYQPSDEAPRTITIIDGKAYYREDIKSEAYLSGDCAMWRYFQDDKWRLNVNKFHPHQADEGFTFTVESLGFPKGETAQAYLSGHTATITTRKTGGSLKFLGNIVEKPKISPPKTTSSCLIVECNEVLNPPEHTIFSAHSGRSLVVKVACEIDDYYCILRDPLERTHVVECLKPTVLHTTSSQLKSGDSLVQCPVYDYLEIANLYGSDFSVNPEKTARRASNLLDIPYKGFLLSFEKYIVIGLVGLLVLYSGASLPVLSASVAILVLYIINPTEAASVALKPEVIACEFHTLFSLYHVWTSQHDIPYLICSFVAFLVIFGRNDKYLVFVVSALSYAKPSPANTLAILLISRFYIYTVFKKMFNKAVSDAENTAVEMQRQVDPFVLRTPFLRDEPLPPPYPTAKISQHSTLRELDIFFENLHRRIMEIGAKYNAIDLILHLLDENTRHPYHSRLSQHCRASLLSGEKVIAKLVHETISIADSFSITSYSAYMHAEEPLVATTELKSSPLMQERLVRATILDRRKFPSISTNRPLKRQVHYAPTPSKNVRNMKNYILYPPEYEFMRKHLYKLSLPQIMKLFCESPRIHSRDIWDVMFFLSLLPKGLRRDIEMDVAEELRQMRTISF